MADPPDDPGRKTGMFKTYEYEAKDQGPYRVILQLLDNQDGKLKINKLSLGRLLTKKDEYKKNIQNLRMLGANRVMAFLSSYQSANNLQKDTLLKKNNLKAYITRNFVSVSGVVAGVPTDMTIDEIKENIKSDVPILDIARLHRYEDGKKVEAQRISITFRSNKLPTEVKMFCCINTVRPFISKPVLCRNCLRYNHQTDGCRSKKRCSNCAQQHENMDEGCQNKTKCLYCKTEHKTTEEDCPERVRQKNIKTIMAKTTLTYMEAREQNPILTQNRYEMLENVDEYPTLPSSYSTITAGSFKPAQGYKPKPQSQKRGVQEVVISKDVEIFKDKRKKTKDNEEQNGTALFNKFKVSEFERWTQHMEEQRKKAQQDPIQKFIDEAMVTAMNNPSASGWQADTQLTNRLPKSQISTPQMEPNT